MTLEWVADAEFLQFIQTENRYHYRTERLIYLEEYGYIELMIFGSTDATAVYENRDRGCYRLTDKGHKALANAIENSVIPEYRKQEYGAVLD